MTKYFILFITCFSCFQLFSQGNMGIDIGQPINPSTGAINPGSDTSVIGPTCTKWVRVNFILGPWSSPTDTTLYNGKTWAQAYGEIIDKLLAKGISIYGLIGTEAYTNPAGILEQFPGADSSLSAAWIAGYTANFVSIVDIFKSKVQVYESYNEPNNWTNSNTAIVHPAWFSLMLQEIYLNTKYFNGHNSIPAWQVNLVSGALFTFDLNDGGQYINDTYWYGKNVYAWDWTHQQTGSYPLDGFGQHIYVEQGSANVSLVTNAIKANLNGFWNNIYVYETNPNKKIWISEFGWESNTYGQQFQSTNLLTGFNVFQNDPRVSLAIWFTLSDFPGGDWGLYNMGTFQTTDRKSAYYTFKNMQTCSIVTGRHSTLEDSKFKIYPNPFNESFSIEGWVLEEKEATVSLYNVMGEKIETWNLVKEKDVFYPKNLKAGAYFIKIRSTTKTSTIKLLKD